MTLEEHAQLGRFRLMHWMGCLFEPQAAEHYAELLRRDQAERPRFYERHGRKFQIPMPDGMLDVVNQARSC